VDDEKNVHKGNGALVPDWFSLTVTGKTNNVPWTNNLATDDYMHGWDAFRFEFFASMDLAWNKNPLAKSFFSEKGLYAFYKKILDTKGKINRGYTIDGKTIRGLRGTDEEGPGPNGAYLSLFTVCEEEPSTKKMLANLLQSYHPDGYWGDNRLEYYEQNWAWLGLAFHLNRGLHLQESLKKSGIL